VSSLERSKTLPQHFLLFYCLVCTQCPRIFTTQKQCWWEANSETFHGQLLHLVSIQECWIIEEKWRFVKSIRHLKRSNKTVPARLCKIDLFGYKFILNAWWQHWKERQWWKEECNMAKGVTRGAQFPGLRITMEAQIDCGGCQNVPTMSQVRFSSQNICFRKTSGSNKGSPNFLLAPGAI